MTNIEEKIEKLIENQINSLGYELYDIQYLKEGKDYYLRVFIDKESGIDLNDCEKVSNEINGILDEADYIKEQYFLEVSSPGIERILRKDKHLHDSIGKEVELKLFKKINNAKQLKGNLKAFNSNYITIQIDNEEIQIDRKDISVIRTIYSW